MKKIPKSILPMSLYRMHPGFIPLDSKSWRIICKDGSFLRGGNDETLKFDSDAEAMQFLSKGAK